MHRPADWLMLLSLVGIWGTSFLVIGIAVESIPPLTVAAARIALGALFLLAVVRATGRQLPATRRLWLHFAALAAVGNALPFFLIAWGQQRIDSGLAGILMGVMPLTTLVLAHFFVPGERMTPRRSLGFAFGFAGVVVLTSPEALLEVGGSSSDLVRQLAVLGGAVCYAANAIIARRLPPTDAIVASASTLLVGTALIVPFAVAWSGPWEVGGSGSGWLAVGWLGLVTTALATIVYYRLIASAGPTFFSTINFLIPGVALAVGVVYGDEHPSWNALAALGLVSVGLVLAQRRSPRQSVPQAGETPEAP